MIVPGSSLPLLRRGWARRFWRIAQVLFVGLWLTASARPVLAEGCHAPEKPVLGMTFSWEVTDLPKSLPETSDLQVPAFSKAPCSSEAPLSSQSSHSVPSLALAIAFEIVAPFSVRRSQAWDSATTLETRDPSFRLDRPPRHRLASV